jgi:hypothetical protein
VRRFPVLAIAFVGTSALLWPAAARADYKDDFKAGRQAIDKSNWAEAARLMRAAASAQPKEGEQVKYYGMRYETYLPQYYLGLALFNTGDCQGALEAWRASEAQDAIKKAKEYKDLVKNKGTCETRTAEAKPTATTKPEATRTEAKPEARPTGPDPAVAAARREAEGELSRAQDAAERVAALSRDATLAPIWAGDSALGGKQKQALDQLASARRGLETAQQKQDARAFSEARDGLARALQQLDAVRQEAEQRKLRLAQATPRPAKTPEGRPTAVAAAGPPPELVQAARAFFGGDYRKTAESLANVEYPAPKTGAQARLFRAAARYALFVTGGQTDEDLRKMAAADVVACRALDPALVPDPQAFSPRFVAFFTKPR